MPFPKLLRLVVPLIVTAPLAFAADAPPVESAVQLPDRTPAPAPSVDPAPPPVTLPQVTVPFPDQERRPLNIKEAVGLDIVDAWAKDPHPPAPGPDGRVVYLYGQSLPSVVCSPLQITDIELQSGELVSPDGVYLGDKVRWTVAPSVSGPEGRATTHLVVKPTAPGLVTSLAVYTNRRTYYFRLVSHPDLWMPRVAFDYPDDPDAQWLAYQASQRDPQLPTERIAGVPLSPPGDAPAALHFDYAIRGDASWTPLRVWNDGVRTTIQFPKTVTQGEAPSLLVVGPDGKDKLVNYRMKGDRYVVDNVFKRAVLLAGVGRKQTRVEIIRKD